MVSVVHTDYNVLCRTFICKVPFITYVQHPVQINFEIVK